MNLNPFKIWTHIIIKIKKIIIKTLSLSIPVTVIDTVLMGLDEDEWAYRECVDEKTMEIIQQKLEEEFK